MLLIYKCINSIKLKSGRLMFDLGVLLINASRKTGFVVLFLILNFLRTKNPVLLEAVMSDTP